MAEAGIARTFQNIRLFPKMTVLENLIVAQHNVLQRASKFSIAGLFKLPGYRQAERQAIERAAMWLERLKLTDLADHAAGDLPYGTQRCIEIARALCANPVLLFSGGKDSICLLRLAEKAIRPGRFPFPLMHIDTGHNYKEVTDFRDKRAAELGERLIVRSVEDSMARGTVVLKSPDESRNKHQSVTLLEAIEEFGFDACIGGARRDEEKARAKERIMSFRDEFGQWDPKNQRPELWSLYNGRLHEGEHMRIFPISNWTELDIWQYIYLEQIPIVPLYFAAERDVIEKNGTPASPATERASSVFPVPGGPYRRTPLGMRAPSRP